jgi:hypothetical protein
MKMRTIALLRLAAATAVLVSSGTAQAVLLDHGPADPTLVFPIWYRDTNGLPLKQCLSQTRSPNTAAAGAPMCFAANPDPAGFPGNVGPEVFYSDLTAVFTNAAFKARYIAAVEATYIPGPTPLHGTETVFARIRILLNTTVGGDYKVTHPYGVEFFPGVGTGKRAIFFTSDVPVGTTMNFEAVLQGQVGPFPQWDVLNPGETLTIPNPATGVTEVFVGDPNFDHTFTGSPFGTNYIRIDGPPGSNLDGAGNDFVLLTTASVVGQKYTAPIPTPTTIKRATYSRDPVKNVVGVDVFATSAPGNTLILTGVNIPSVQMTGDATGHYFAHVEMPATLAPPASIQVQVNNTTSVPTAIVQAALVDELTIGTATYDTLTSTLTVAATSSDQIPPGPLLSVDGPLGGLMTAGAYSKVLPAGTLPPRNISVQSSAGGVAREPVAVLTGAPMNLPNAPVAVADAMTTPENAAVSFDVTANDVIVAPALVKQVVIITPALNGTAAPIGINTGVVTYTPAPNFFGTDTFSYVVIDTTGAVSNVATVTMTVSFLAPGPTVLADNFAMLVNKTLPLAGRTYNVLANDGASPGTTIDPASVKITTLPLHGDAIANADGTVTYKPVLNYIGVDTFNYTVANTAGNVSLPATVTVVVEGAPEILSLKRVVYTVAKNTWTLSLTTTWFGPQLTQSTLTCYVGKVVGGPLIGTAIFDVTGTTTVISGPTTPPPDATNTFTCKSSNGAVIIGVVKRV